MKKRFLSMFLCMALMIGCMPFVEAASKPGNSKETAVQVTMGTTYNYQWVDCDYDYNDDNDSLWCCVNLTKNGVLHFESNKLSSVPDKYDYADFYIYDALNIQDEIWRDYSNLHKEAKRYCFNIPLSAGKYYFRLDPIFYLNTEMSRKLDYIFTFTESDIYETEPNNSIETADIIAINNKINAYSDNSEDYFKITVNKNTPVKIKIGNHETLADSGVAFSLIRPDGVNEYLEFSMINANDYWYVNAVLRTGTNYIQVTNPFADEMLYWIEVSDDISIGKPSVKNAKINKKNLVLTWSQVKDVSGYEVYKKINNGKWELLTSCTKDYANITQKDIDLSKDYQFKIRAFKVISGIKVYSSYSDVKTIKATPTNIKLSTTSYTYNGKTRTPSVTIKDKTGKKLTKNVDYTVNYASGRKKVGTYKVTIIFKGNYSGTVTKTFKINPKKASLKSFSKGQKQIKVKWSKVTSETTGYQIQYSTSSKFKSAKTVTIKKNKTTSTTIKSLKSNKKYYVRVRTYKTVSGKKYYSSWSSAKNVKTK